MPPTLHVSAPGPGTLLEKDGRIEGGIFHVDLNLQSEFRAGGTHRPGAFAVPDLDFPLLQIGQDPQEQLATGLLPPRWLECRHAQVLPFWPDPGWGT